MWANYEVSVSTKQGGRSLQLIGLQRNPQFNLIEITYSDVKANCIVTFLTKLCKKEYVKNGMFIIVPLKN